MKGVLLVVDVQNDFCTGGSIRAAFGDEIIPTLNGYLELFRESNLPVVATIDSLLPESATRERFGGAWPAECVPGPEETRFHPGLRLPPGTVVVSTGSASAARRSAFCGTSGDGKDLQAVFREMGATDIFVGGLAVEYRVRDTVLEAVGRGYRVTLLRDAVKGTGDSSAVMEEMRRNGVGVTTFAEMASLLRRK